MALPYYELDIPIRNACAVCTCDWVLHLVVTALP